MSRTRNIAVVALSASLAMSALPAVATANPLAGSSQSPYAALADHSGIQAALLHETNVYRASRGLAPLSGHHMLDNVAQSWSETMASQRHLRHNPSYVNHYPSSWRKAAENVSTFNQSVAARDMLQAWLNSPSHRRNVENPDFTHVGVGWATSSDGSVYATQNFAAL